MIRNIKGRKLQEGIKRPVSFSRDFKDGSSIYGVMFPDNSAKISIYDQSSDTSTTVPVRPAVFSNIKDSRLGFEDLSRLVLSYM